jgi:hypothetical protein
MVMSHHQVINGAPMESKPIIIKQTLAHDVIIKELNVQGGMPTSKVE